MTTTKEQVRDHGSGTRRAGPDRPTLRFFYSPTSGPSRRVEAFLAQVLQRRQNHRTFELQRVNCDKHPELVERYAVTQMPTLIVIEGRRVLGRLEGSCGCREIEKLLEPWLNRGARARASRERNGTSPHTGAAVSSKASEDRVLSATTIRTTRRSTNWSTKPRERHGTEITEDRLTAGHTL